jgi:type II secretory pathway pseudopilin PulG
MESFQELDSDRGITLVELLVYSMLLILVLSVAGGLISGTTSTSKTVGSITQATTAGQLAANSVQKGIRNSSDFQLTTPAGSDQLLIARTAKGEATLTWMCAAWYYSAAGTGSIYYTTSLAAIPVPTSTDLTHWTLLDRGVRPVTGTDIFTANAEQIAINFKGLAGGYPPVIITSSALSRAGGTGVPACY